MKGALDEWRVWLRLVAFSAAHGLWSLVEALIQSAMLAIFIRLAAMRGILLIPA